jgi:genome maintenance exonuclease 1
VPVYCENLYAGTTDCVGVWNGEPAIIDFKQSLKHKKREWITDYFCQLGSYALAHNEMFGTDIKKGVILMCVQDGTYLEFIVEGKEWEKSTLEWCDKLSAYYDK